MKSSFVIGVLLNAPVILGGKSKPSYDQAKSKVIQRLKDLPERLIYEETKTLAGEILDFGHQVNSAEQYELLRTIRRVAKEVEWAKNRDPRSVVYVSSDSDEKNDEKNDGDAAVDDTIPPPFDPAANAGRGYFAQTHWDLQNKHKTLLEDTLTYLKKHGEILSSPSFIESRHMGKHIEPVEETPKHNAVNRNKRSMSAGSAGSAKTAHSVAHAASSGSSESVASAGPPPGPPSFKMQNTRRSRVTQPSRRYSHRRRKSSGAPPPLPDKIHRMIRGQHRIQRE